MFRFNLEFRVEDVEALDREGCIGLRASECNVDRVGFYPKLPNPEPLNPTSKHDPTHPWKTF